MNFISWLLLVGIIILLIYLAILNTQINNISKQLDKRLNEKTCQPINILLISKVLNNLVIKINRSFKAEENLRLKVVEEEKEFKSLISNISHDLRTPLTSIKGYQQLVERGELSAEQREKLEIANKHCDELGQLINHFFEYSLFLNNDNDMIIEKINLTNLLTECLVANVNSFEEKNISIDYVENSSVYFIGDKELITRIIQNLIRNCIQHSVGKVKVRLFSEENIIISFMNPVKNSKEIEVDKLFNKFYTGDKSRRYSGGLGLSIVKILTERMGGKVSANLKDDNLEITVELPRKVVI